MSYSKLTILGNLGRDPELRKSSSMVSYCTFSVAVSSGRKGEPGDTLWVEVVCFGPVAESCSVHLSKGSKVLVEGSPEVRAYMPREGSEPRAVLKLKAVSVTFVSSAKDKKEDHSYSDGSWSDKAFGAEQMTPSEVPF